MAPSKKNGTVKASGGRRKSRSKSNSPKTPPRPRVMCPGCSTELTLHKTRSSSQAIIYASKTDMKKFDIECNNESCPLYIEGVENVDNRVLVNPLVEKAVNVAKAAHAAITAAKKEKGKEEKAESKKRKREDKDDEYAKYDPFSGAKEKEAKDAPKLEKEVYRERKRIVKGWEKIQKAAERLEKLENAMSHVEE